MSSVKLYLLVCFNCHRVMATEKAPPECFTFKCSGCGYDEYSLYAIEAQSLADPEHGLKKLVKFRERHER